MHFLNSELSAEFIKDIDPATGRQSGNVEKFSTDFTIPLPPLATQQAIVAEIEAEQTLVAANRELIARFEKKIQATLAASGARTSRPWVKRGHEWQSMASGTARAQP